MTTPAYGTYNIVAVEKGIRVARALVRHMEENFDNDTETRDRLDDVTWCLDKLEEGE